MPCQLLHLFSVLLRIQILIDEFIPVFSMYDKDEISKTCFCVPFTDLSKNKLSELPHEITQFTALEKLNLYHNVIRFIPDTVMYLQSLTYLDIR